MQDITCHINKIRRIYPAYYTNNVIYSARYWNTIGNPGISDRQYHCGSGMETGTPVRRRYLVNSCGSPALLAKCC
jgi:hypothetical protein